MLEGYTWNLGEYVSARGTSATDSITVYEAEHFLELCPPPSKRDELNDYIVKAQATRELRYLAFFLHYYEKRLNRRIKAFLHADGTLRCSPDAFMDYKLACLAVIFEKLPTYRPNAGAKFTTYLHRFLADALLECRRQAECWSFPSLEHYKRLRQAAWQYHALGAQTVPAVTAIAAQAACKPNTALCYLREAVAVRSRQPFYLQEEEDDAGEDVTEEPVWNDASQLLSRMEAAAIQHAFGQLDYREQALLEGRNAICMGCGKVLPLSSRASLEELAVMFEGSGTSGAARAYQRAVEKLTIALVEAGILHAVSLRQKSTVRRGKQIAAAVYQYQADCDGQWGKIQLDWEQHTAEIISLADWDLTKTHPFASKAMAYLLSCAPGKVPKSYLLTFRM